MVEPTKACVQCKRDFETGELIHVDKKTGDAICDPCDEDMWHADLFLKGMRAGMGRS